MWLVLLLSTNNLVFSSWKYDRIHLSFITNCGHVADLAFYFYDLDSLFVVVTALHNQSRALFILNRHSTPRNIRALLSFSLMKGLTMLPTLRLS